jgi:hypothetical protein
MTAPNAAERPMLKTRAGFGDPLDFHARLADRATGPGGLDGFLNLGHGAPLLEQAGAHHSQSPIKAEGPGGDPETMRFVGKARKLIRAGRSRTLTAMMVPAAGTIRPPSA